MSIINATGIMEKYIQELPRRNIPRRHAHMMLEALILAKASHIFLNSPFSNTLVEKLAYQLDTLVRKRREERQGLCPSFMTFSRKKFVIITKDKIKCQPNLFQLEQALYWISGWDIIDNYIINDNGRLFICDDRNRNNTRIELLLEDTEELESQVPIELDFGDQINNLLRLLPIHISHNLGKEFTVMSSNHLICKLHTIMNQNHKDRIKECPWLMSHDIDSLNVSFKENGIEIRKPLLECQKLEILRWKAGVNIRKEYLVFIDSHPHFKFLNGSNSWFYLLHAMKLFTYFL